MYHYRDYIDAGFRVFGLYGVDASGKCECGNPKCQAFYKHPRTKSWQNTPHWSEDQLDMMEEMGQFKTGFGVIVDDHLVIDIDPRNGGDEGYKKLCQDTGIDFKKESGFVVATGGGGWHIYFNRPNIALMGKLPQYDGVDFKSSGFVVGAGSVHASGVCYEIEKGDQDSLTDAPQKLLDLLEKKNTYRARFEGRQIDIDDAKIRDLLSYYKNDNLEYDDWLNVGMAIHDATQGEGYELWEEWSASSGKHDDSMMLYKWHSFGKAANPVTIGTLIHLAQEKGYKEPVTFESDELKFEIPKKETTDIDINRPPGFVGDLAAWINSQCRFPRERLAVAAALSSVGNIGGLRFVDGVYGVTSNQFIFCVAGSATGKEAVQQAQAKIHRAAGIHIATHGAIKSEQEIIRNMIDHQAAYYIIDEMGLVLQKIANARKRGGAAYLEGVVGTLMSAYSKAGSFMLLSGDIRKDIKKQLNSEFQASQKAVDHNEDDSGFHARKLEQLRRQLASIDNGLERPFLSLIGYTTPVTFNQLVDYEQSANGFIGRSLVVEEKNTNPKAKKNFKPQDMPKSMQLALAGMFGGNGELYRVEHLEEPIKIPTEKAAQARLEEIEEYFYNLAEQSKEVVLEAIPRRAFELVLKTSLTLAIPGRVRTLEHVEWSFEYVKNDIQNKINLAASNMASEESRNDEALLRKIVGILDYDHGETQGVIVNRCRSYKKEDVIKALEILTSNNTIKKEETARTARYYLK